MIRSYELKFNFKLLLIILISSISLTAFSQVKIGVAIPLMKSGSAEDKKLGDQMSRGIKDALEEYEKTKPSTKVTLVYEDTRRDQSASLQAINKLASDTSVIVIFGPVFSSEIVNNAGAAAFHKIPVVSPTATQNDLATNNPYFFQLNPTYEVRGMLIAAFAMNELKMKNFAILSEETYGKNFTEGFKDEVRSKNGTIVTEMFYEKNGSLQEKMTELKTDLARNEKFIDFGKMTPAELQDFKKYNFDFSNVDSMAAEKLIVSIYKLFGPRAERVTDSLGIKSISGSSIDIEGNLIFGLTDGVYIAISGPQEVSQMTADYFSSRINLPVLGNTDWNNEQVLNENKMYVKELYYDSDFFLKDKDNGDLTAMSDADIRNYYFGYDGMKLLLSQIAEGKKSRRTMNDALESLKDFQSEHNNVTMKDRTNARMSVMSFSKGELKRVGEYVVD